MNLYKVAATIDAQILTPTLDLSREVCCAYGADLLSDVLAFTRPRTLLLTGLFNLQVVRTAEMAELAGIIVVRGKTVDQSLLDLACASQIPVLGTKLTMFESCGRLYKAGMLPCSRDAECANNVCHAL